MKESLNKELKEDFVEGFMHDYRSPGINICLYDEVYGNRFEVTELRNSYKVYAAGKTKRFSTLCYVAEFLYKECFNQSRIYVPPEPKRKNYTMLKAQKMLKNFLLRKVLDLLRLKVLMT